MTKLLEWLSVFVVLSSAYLVIVTRQIQSKLLDEWMLQITVLPIIAVALFGVSRIREKSLDYLNIFMETCFLSSEDLLSDNRFVPCVYI